MIVEVEVVVTVEVVVFLASATSPTFITISTTPTNT
jgi:hypothetical protein